MPRVAGRPHILGKVNTDQELVFHQVDRAKRHVSESSTVEGHLEPPSYVFERTNDALPSSYRSSSMSFPTASINASTVIGGGTTLWSAPCTSMRPLCST